MYQKLQTLLPEFMIESVTMDNLSTYETIFYNNKEYYCLTDGKPATRELCEEFKTYIEKEKRGEVSMEDIKQYLDRKYKVKEG